MHQENMLHHLSHESPLHLCCNHHHKSDGLLQDPNTFRQFHKNNSARKHHHPTSAHSHKDTLTRLHKVMHPTHNHIIVLSSQNNRSCIVLQSHKDYFNQSANTCKLKINELNLVATHIFHHQLMNFRCLK